MTTVGGQIVSGSLSGLAVSFVLQPLDLLKTRVQQSDGLVKAGHSSQIVTTARNILAANGPSGLWQGTSASLVRNIPAFAAYGTGLIQVRTILARNEYFTTASTTNSSSTMPQLNKQGNLLAGTIVQIGVGIAFNPFNVLKARFESDIHAYKSITGALVSMAHLGPAGLMRGFLATALRDVPCSALFVLLYEGFKQELSHISLTRDYAAVINSTSAGLASGIAAVATHPFDVIKTKMQVRSEDCYRGLGRTTRTVWLQRGMSGFFDGVSLRLASEVLRNAISWAVFESALKYLHPTN